MISAICFGIILLLNLIYSERIYMMPRNTQLYILVTKFNF
jgi:hypothetical protein